MGQGGSRQAGGGAAASLLVDLDNAAFGPGGDMDAACLERRLRVLDRAFHGARRELFGNAATRAFLQRSRLPLGQATWARDNAKDAADHALLRALLHRRGTCVVVTADRTLARMAAYLRPPATSLVFATFRGTCDALELRYEQPLAFADAADLDRFMRSLDAFRRGVAPARTPARGKGANKRKGAR